MSIFYFLFRVLLLLSVSSIAEVFSAISSTILSRCEEDGFRYGVWTKNSSNCGLMSNYTHTLKDTQVKYLQMRNETILRMLGWKPPGMGYPFADWCWKPRDCTAELFSIDSLCNKLRGRSILIVGDSTQHQFYEALYMQLDEPGSPIDQWTVRQDMLTNKSSFGICAGKGGGRLAYLRNDQIRITGNTQWNNPAPLWVMSRHWPDVADEFDILVLNKGAHYHGSNEEFVYVTNTTAQYLKNTWLPSKKGKGHIFYRPANPGHINGTALSVADTTPVNSEPQFNCGNEHQQYWFCGRYSWAGIVQRNPIALKIFDEALRSTGHYTVLHTYPMTSLRPDGHNCPYLGDCKDKLHYFLPSVVDSWVQLLHHFLPI